jgi:hypothetical protein
MVLTDHGDITCSVTNKHCQFLELQMLALLPPTIYVLIQLHMVYQFLVLYSYTNDAMISLPKLKRTAILVQDSQISTESAHEGGKFVSLMNRPPLPPQEIFLVLISVRG